VILGPLKWYDVAEALRSAAHDAMAATPSGPPARSCVVPGSIAWDDCTCGMLAVSVNRVYPSEPFPVQQTTVVSGQCTAAWQVAEIVIQAIRCAPQPEGQDLAPSCTALAASAVEINRDAHDVYSAVERALCQMRDTDVVDYLISGQTFQGPAGGCVGSELRVLVGLPRD
jgi:hypothetical protein